jgi:hypothetical protein
MVCATVNVDRQVGKRGEGWLGFLSSLDYVFVCATKCGSEVQKAEHLSSGEHIAPRFEPIQDGEKGALRVVDYRLVRNG